MYMQQQQPMLSTEDFNMAAEIDTRNPDVYHHRGQVGGHIGFLEHLFGNHYPNVCTASAIEQT